MSDPHDTAWRAMRAIVAGVTAKGLPEPSIRGLGTVIIVLWRSSDESFLRGDITDHGSMVVSYRYTKGGRRQERFSVPMRPSRFVDLATNILLVKP